MSSSRILIGHIVQFSLFSVLCDGDACVVFGSRREAKSYMAKHSQISEKKYSIKKAWFEDILRGIQHDAPYAFDEAAYRLFYPRAKRIGLILPPPDFSLVPPSDLAQPSLPLLRVQGASFFQK